MKKIYLANTGNFALIDDADYELVSRIGKWYESDSGYAVWRGNINGQKITIRMHRLIAEPANGLVVDHINRVRLDNRRCNLRCVTQKTNSQNTEKVEKAKGYYLSSSKSHKFSHWVVDFRGVVNTFRTEEEAKEAVAAIKANRFVKNKDKIHQTCPKCGTKKGYYGGCWTCRTCALRRSKEYYKRKKGGNYG